MKLTELINFLHQGGSAIWVIAGLSIIMFALILWRLWAYWLSGIWQDQNQEAWLALVTTHRSENKLYAKTPLQRVIKTAIEVLKCNNFTTEMAQSEITRIAKGELALLRRGLRPLELIATIAPLIGLLGTVLGMITAFQALQDSGNASDPSVLAGGIWEALLTTAAGMAVAIPASAALSWFESIIENVQMQMEDAATRVFTSTIH